MRLTASLLPILVLVACTDVPKAAEPAPTVATAYVIIQPASLDQGWDVLEAIDTEMSPTARTMVQARGLVSGASKEMMIRFGGNCEKDATFVAEVRRVAVKHGVSRLRCASVLPGD